MYSSLESKFEYPKNPSFLKTAFSQKLVTLSGYLQDNGITSTQKQEDSKKKQRIKLEYKFWKEGLSKILNGFSDHDFDEALVNFLEELNFDRMSDLDKKLLYSQALLTNDASKKGQKLNI